MKATFEIPLRTKTGLNSREHWAARQKRVKAERAAVAYGFLMSRDALWIKTGVLCFSVTLTRIGPRFADDDNVIGGLKAVRDAIAENLGVDDGDRERIRFRYEQERGPWGVRIEIESVKSFAPAAQKGVSP